MMQTRNKDGTGPWYSAGRDIAYLVPSACDRTLQLIEGNTDQELHRWLEGQVSREQIRDAFYAYCAMLKTVGQEDRPSPGEACASHGYLQAPWQARVAIEYYMGMIVTATFLQAAPFAYGKDHEPPTTLALGFSALEEYARCFAAPWWKRAWYWLLRVSGWSRRERVFNFRTFRAR